ncbi:MAG: hypothetical protein SGARI_004217 [Bacillariaceae sp.]
MARRCPGAPITIEAGTVCCAYKVHRNMIKSERNLGDDPTEVRVNKCIGFFSALASKLCMLGCCVCVSSRLIGCCANDSEGAQACSSQGVRAGNACRSCARTCWRGIWSVQMMALGCASAQMEHELKEGKPLVNKPVTIKMDRGGGGGAASTERSGGGDDTDSAEEDQWWKEKKDNF